MLLKRSRAAAPESLPLNGSFRSCRHLREALEQPLQDDEVHPIGSAGLAAVRARAKGAWAARTNDFNALKASFAVRVAEFASWCLSSDFRTNATTQLANRSLQQHR